MAELPIVKHLKIEKLFGYSDININFNAVTVIVGKNGMGKTTLLKILQCLLSDKTDMAVLKKCKSAYLSLSGNNSISYGDLPKEELSDFAKSVMKYTVESFVNEKSISKKMLNTMKKSLENRDIMDKWLASIDSEIYYHSNFYNTLNNKIRYSNPRRKINVRYISTVNISANSDKNLDVGNSIEKNILNLAIEDELRELTTSRNNKKVISILIETLNELFAETHKTCKIKNNSFYCEDTTSKETLNISHLSSGERQLIYILATAANTYGKPFVFLMDEPEISLHMSWQETIINSIRKINPKIQLVIVTHSPAIVMNGYMDAYVDIKDIMMESSHG
ncbi:AAA family ATPase [Citrobacter werkmanii]|uniref:AAA family ATPase n=1 Tax=Citrobacter werkmanii TaxID=67827 RepID=UPI0028886D40|nr:AAA family ATPase [Citrobacter werkmanii]MDT0639862.1 AAA family ATPase [Citrobacter werkmanii]